MSSPDPFRRFPFKAAPDAPRFSKKRRSPPKRTPPVGLSECDPPACRPTPEALRHAAESRHLFFFLYPQSQYGPPEASVYCRTKSVTPPASLMV